MKKIKINTECGHEYEIDLHEIADNRAKYYAKTDTSTTYEEEYEYVMEDYQDEALDWLLNNMDWYETSSLRLVQKVKKKPNDMKIKKVKII